MRVLSLDTTTRVLSAAIVDDGRVIAAHVGDARRTHAERLPGALMDLLRDAGAGLSAIDAFAVAAGPGSFTGLRIGIATIQGLAFVHRRRIVPVSALEALAYAAADGEGSGPVETGTTVAAWIDAHRRDVFSAAYRVRPAPACSPTRLEEIAPPTVDPPSATLTRWAAAGIGPHVFIGSGAVLYAEALGGSAVLVPPPLAPIVGRVAVERARAGGGVDPAAVQPLYVRRPDAELARER